MSAQTEYEDYNMRRIGRLENEVNALRKQIETMKKDISFALNKVDAVSKIPQCLQ